MLFAKNPTQDSKQNIGPIALPRGAKVSWNRLPRWKRIDMFNRLPNWKHIVYTRLVIKKRIPKIAFKSR